MSARSRETTSTQAEWKFQNLCRWRLNPWHNVYLHGIRLISTPGSWSCGSHGSRSASLCFRCFRRGNFIPGGFVIRGIPFRNARFSFFRNQRSAASFSIQSASSFRAHAVSGLVITESLIEIQTSTHRLQSPFNKVDPTRGDTSDTLQNQKIDSRPSQ
jgi:hypothetical protein